MLDFLSPDRPEERLAPQGRPVSLHQFISGFVLFLAGSIQNCYSEQIFSEHPNSQNSTPEGLMGVVVTMDAVSVGVATLYSSFTSEIMVGGVCLCMSCLCSESPADSVF